MTSNLIDHQPASVPEASHDFVPEMVEDRVPALNSTSFPLSYVEMRCSSARQMLALFLAVFVTLGMSLSAVRASDMAAKMTMASEMGASGHSGCQACGACATDKTKAMACASICAASVMAVLPQTAPAMLVETSVSFPRHYPLLHGWASQPDPYPPRPSSLG